MFTYVCSIYMIHIRAVVAVKLANTPSKISCLEFLFLHALLNLEKFKYIKRGFEYQNLNQSYVNKDKQANESQC